MMMMMLQHLVSMGRLIMTVLRTLPDAFRYIDSLEKQDDLVSKSEFSTAFDVAATELSIFPYCVWLHSHFWNSSQAWDAMAEGHDLDKSRWGVVWLSYEPPFNFTKPSAKQSFLFLDADDDGVLTRTEFDSIFHYCHNTPSPIPEHGNTSEPYRFTTDLPTTTLHHTTTTTSSRAPSHCCAEVSAQCLSCIAGITAQELCSRNSMSLIPGCKGPASTLHVQAAPGDPHQNAEHTTSLPLHYVQDGAGSRQCPQLGVAFSPALSGQNQSTEDGLAACQARCVRTLGCGYFTYWRNSSSCELHPIAASGLPQPEAAGGPAVCVARFKARIASVVFSRLLKSQLGSLHASLPEALAHHFGTPVSEVQDVGGKPAAVTLLPGSLLVEGKVLLPSGAAVRDVADKSAYDQNGGLRKNVANALLAANVPYMASGDPVANPEEAIPMTLAITADPSCFVEGVDFLAGHQEVAAQNAPECQTKCYEAGNCTIFSYYRATKQCRLTGANASSASPNEAAVSGPARCAFIPAASAREANPAGTDVLALVHESPWFYQALAGLVLFLLVVLTFLGCWCEKKEKRKRGKEAKWHGKALYLPVASEEGEGQERRAREVSRDGPDTQPHGGHVADPRLAAKEPLALGFRGADILSWRQNGQPM
ncbi:unnamed protein product [Symbiodinium natans]|uniref:Calmodulin n=1 Tax=Symbiodinium natans TaxID=878477 RepID=A0A812SBW3_9DINO|nr:unnamed protein product [Symbiodinium natans]